MARVKLSEWKVKQLLADACEIDFQSVSVNKESDFSLFDPQLSYVVKVDQGLKKRFKNGLVKLDVKGGSVQFAVSELSAKGYQQFIVESFLKYDSTSERYLSLERVREGIRVLYSRQGGVDVEEQTEQIQVAVVNNQNDMNSVAEYIGLSTRTVSGIYTAFETNYFSFLEINPLVITDSHVYFLDAAGEVDSTAQFFVKSWTKNDIVTPLAEVYEEESQVEAVASRSQAALTLKVLNPNGSIFLLLSGGGASIVMADEIYDMGYGNEIANYGEYSGNPSTEETYLYTKSLLSLLLKSSAPNKVLVIGGGVANFTDIRLTFRGVIQAIDEVSAKLFTQQVKIFVRRGGPFQEEGLQMMQTFLESKKLLGAVMGPDQVLIKAVVLAVEELQKGKYA